MTRYAISFVCIPTLGQIYQRLLGLGYHISGDAIFFQKKENVTIILFNNVSFLPQIIQEYKGC
jgi:hypothetical protein